MPSPRTLLLSRNVRKKMSTGCSKNSSYEEVSFCCTGELGGGRPGGGGAGERGGGGGDPAGAAAQDTVGMRDTTYLRDVREALEKKWPANRTINLVFHGHSVPAGYFRTPDVRTFEAYPCLVGVGLKKLYPYAVINIIVTAIGGENSE